mgnify:CR=1 FL=1
MKNSSVLGIIAEYDPFHNGHKYLIDSLKEETKSEFVVCIMSGAFLQRGAPAMFSCHDRAEMALMSGCDVVFSMPLSFSCAPAHRFAHGAVDIMNRLGIIDFIGFGVESSCIETLKACRESYPKDFTNKDYSLPLAKKAETLSGSADGSLEFNKPNLSLALCYENELRLSKSRIIPVPISRTNSHSSRKIEADFSSASAIREAITKGELSSVKKAVPDKSFDIISKALYENRFVLQDDFDRVLFALLYRLDKDYFNVCPELIEGLGNKLFNELKKCTSKNELILRLKSKRYTYTRLARGLINACIGLRETDLEKKAGFIRLLGFSKNGLKLLNKIDKDKINIFSSLADISKAGQRFDVYAEELWNICAGLPIAEAYKRKIIKL